MIKLKPDHVGTRVLLSDGKIRLVMFHAATDDGGWWEGRA